MYMNFVKIAPNEFRDDGMSYQERMRREAAKKERPAKIGRFFENAIVGAIRWTFLAAVFAIVGSFFFLVVGGLIHG